MPFPHSTALPDNPGTGRLPPRQRVGLIAATLVAALLAAFSLTRGGIVAPLQLAREPRTAVGPSAAERVPFFRQSWITPSAHTRSAHSSSICVLPGGDLLALWYGGSREGASDVALYTARRAPGVSEWAAPQTAVNRASAESELERPVKKVGNAVIFPDRSGLLWMVYVSVSVGGWSGSALNVKTSRDEGRTWGGSRRLTLNPFLNLSSLVRNKPIHASDGRIGLPVYHELAMKFPQMLWLTPGRDGTVEECRIRNLAAEAGLIQPTLVPLDGDRVLMVLRDHRQGGRRVHTAYSDDNGWTWAGAEPIGLPNPDSAIDALRLRDGRVLLVYNHGSHERDILRLAISGDDGRTWRPGPVIEADARREFSYPFLVEDQGGRIHLTYTWLRERIRHVEFNVAWLNRRVAELEAGTQ